MVFFKKDIFKNLCNNSINLAFEKNSLKPECCEEVFNQAELGQKYTQMLTKQPELL